MPEIRPGRRRTPLATFGPILAFAIAAAFGFTPVESGYLAMAMAFSSTIIVVKLLTDRHELEVLHARIAIGILIVQDIVVVLAMIGLSGFEGDTDGILSNSV